MATPKELLAASLEILHKTERDGVIRSSEISRTHRERLKRNGFLEEVIKGWLLVTNPALLKGSSTSGYVSFWPFIRRYLNERFGDGYCLSPEASIKIHTGSTLVPKQLIVITEKKGVQTLSLPFGTSLLMYQDKKNFPTNRVKKMASGLWSCRLHYAGCPQHSLKMIPMMLRSLCAWFEMPLPSSKYSLKRGASP